MSYWVVNQVVESHVSKIFQDHPNEKLLYHNLEHTRRVVEHANEIALFYKMHDESLFIINTAAWFHDVGYVVSGPNKHEEEGARLMKDFILDIDLSSMLVSKIRQCIIATKRAAPPVSLSERIMCDADTYHFGTPEFRQTDPLIKKEIELLTGTVQTKWISDTIRMLQDHQFYTSYCRNRLNSGKLMNLEWVQSLLKTDL